MKKFYCSMFAVVAVTIVRGATSDVVLAPENAGAPTVQKLAADLFQADLGFRMAGIEVEDVAVEGANYQSIGPIAEEKELFGSTAEEGRPELPIYAHMVAIPDQSGARLEILSYSYETLENYDIMPVQTPAIEGSDQILPFVKDDEFYSRDEFYPGEIARLGEPIICRDLRMIQVILNPVQYNPATRELRIYTSIDYNIIYEGFDNRNAKIRRSNRIAESYLSLYRAMAPNADEILSAYEPVRGGYLIITPDAFLDTISVLARWKHLKGYNVVVATASEVDPNGSDPTNIEVKNYIQNAYNTWEYPPEFICIVGDVDGTYRITDYPWSGYNSDHQYARLDGTDLIPDVMISRMSVRSLSELRVAMEKALRFDMNPFMGDPAYYLRGLSSAGNIGSVTPRLTTLWVRQRLLEIGYNRVDTVFAWSTGDPGADSIQAAMSRGVTIISYRGWGFSSQWGAPVFPSSRIDQLTHGWKIGICLAITCGIGNFGATECWGEKWIRAGTVTTPKGGPAFFGSTDGSTHTKWNNPIMYGYYWGLFKEGIYHFGLAAARGKMQMFNTFPNRMDRVEKYHHTYNTLGEPELDIRTAVPKTLQVGYLSTIPVGTNMLEVSVNVEGGFPLEGAYVNLVKGYGGSEEVFVGGWTDATGHVTLHFNTTVRDTLFVTVTNRNCIPHRGFSLVETQPVAVGINASVIDDDNSGNSSGNSDGNVNPSETVEFDVTLHNFGNSTTATNVQATMSCDDPAVTITVPSQSYGDIAPGNSAGSGKFAASFDAEIPHNEHIHLLLAITSDQGSWTAAVPVDVKSMFFLHLGTQYPGNVNGRLDPGETSSVVFQLQNLGELGGTALQGVLSTSNSHVIITDNTADFGNIGIGETGSNSASPFAVALDEAIYNGANINFDLELTSSNGSVTGRTIPVTVGIVASYDPVGPDNYGYYMYDNTDAGYSQAPVYNWIEISPYAGGPGSRVTFSGNTDDNSTVVSLPFGFVYYGDTYNYMLVCINGFVAFDTSRIDMGGNRYSNSHNMPIPGPGAPYGTIAPYWDDIEYSGNNGVFQYYDSNNHRYIIEWKNCTHAVNGSQQTFQMIIYDPEFYPTPTGDAEMVFQYQTVNNIDGDGGEEPGLYCTVGFQNYEINDGLEYTFDNIYNPGAATLVSGRAIKVTTDVGLAPPPEIAYDPSSFHAYAGVGESAADTLSISNTGEGNLVFTISEIQDDRRLRDDRPRELSLQPEPIGSIERPFNKEGDRVELIYPPVITDFGGPDNFGHRWIDSDEPNGPAYSWVDISGVGTEVFPGEDGSAGPFSIGFSFPFYENSYSSIYINSNGDLTFGSGSGVYNNSNIPNSGDPNNLIAIFWDDLSPQYGHVYYYHDTVNNRFIASYVDVPNWNLGGALDFQAILYPSGQIFLQYGTLDPGSDNLYSNTIGIENASGTDGLQIAYDNVYVHSDMAIRISTSPSWLSSSIHSGLLQPGEDTIAVITFDASELEEGDYTGSLRINCNDPGQSQIDIPVTFTVGSGPVCDYVVGDYNGNNIFNIADIISAFSKLQTGSPEPAYLCECPHGSGNIWAVAMDLNNTCNFNIADIVVGFSKLQVGTPEPVPCDDCPPGGRRINGDSNDRPLIVPGLKSKVGKSGSSW